MIEILDNLAECVEKGKVSVSSVFPPSMKGMKGADELTKEAIDASIPPNEILKSGLMKGMERIGVKFKENKVFVPDVLMSAKAMNSGMKHLKPFFTSGEVSYKGTVVIGTVVGDLHDIGKNIVGMIVEGGGWKVVDLGVDVPAEKFISCARETNAHAICLSALLTTTMMNMELIINKVKSEIPELKVLVGGAPLSSEYANQIKADCYSPDPQGALDYLNSLLN